MEPIVLFLLAFIIFTLWKGVIMVPQGFEYTVERFRKYTHTQTPGIGIIFPTSMSVARST
jgi:regulator of protease activity HflC (stomatin/prohibitin superfamily)